MIHRMAKMVIATVAGGSLLLPATILGASWAVLPATSAFAADDPTEITIQLPVEQEAVEATNTKEGYAVRSEGATVQVPVHIPVNVCGNTVNVIGLLNPAFGNTCVND